MRARSLCQCMFLVWMLVATGSALAATTLTYQGQLQDSDGPFEGTVDLTFVLYEVPSGGSPIASPIVKDNVEVSDGLFQVELDFGQAFDGDPKWIEIEVDETLLSERQRVTSVPVAQYALSAPSGDSIWEVTNSNAWYLDGNVGIGTDVPSTDFVVAGSATIGNNNNEASGNFSFASGSGAHASATESFIAGGRDNQASGRGGFVGGGIDNVAGGQFSFAAGRAAEALHNDSFVWASGSWSSFASTDDNQFLIRADGVGINTNQPSTPLHVMGDTAIGGGSEDYRLGVGTSNPWTPLHVVSNEDQGPMRIMVGDNSTSSTSIRAYSHQGVAIGNSWTDGGVPDRGMRLYGDLWVGGDIYGLSYSSSQSFSKVCAESNTGNPMLYRLYACPNESDRGTSSRRYKEDIEPLEFAADMVERMEAVSFRWKESGKEDIGLIAEDIAEIEPRLVFDNRQGEIEGINYSHLTAVLVRAMQERQQTVEAELAAVREAHSSEIEARDRQIAELRRELDDQRDAYDERLAVLEELLLEGSQLARESESN